MFTTVISQFMLLYHYNLPLFAPKSILLIFVSIQTEPTAEALLGLSAITNEVSALAKKRDSLSDRDIYFTSYLLLIRPDTLSNCKAFSFSARPAQ